MSPVFAWQQAMLYRQACLSPSLSAGGLSRNCLIPVPGRERAASKTGNASANLSSALTKSIDRQANGYNFYQSMRLWQARGWSAKSKVPIHMGTLNRLGTHHCRARCHSLWLLLQKKNRQRTPLRPRIASRRTLAKLGSGTKRHTISLYSKYVTLRVEKLKVASSFAQFFFFLTWGLLGLWLQALKFTVLTLAGFGRAYLVRQLCRRYGSLRG